MLPIIVFITFFFGLLEIGATDKYNLVKDYFENIYYVQNGLPDHYGSDIQFKFTINGIPAFCLDPKLSIKKYDYFGIPLKQSNFDIETQEYLNKVIYYGYDYPNHKTERYYMATQALIWEKVSNYLIEFYTERYGYGTYIDVSNEKSEILNLINNHYKLPYFAGQHYDYSLTDYLEFEDDILTEFEIMDSNWHDVVIENNKLKIKNLSDFVGTINVKLKKKFYRNDIATYYYEDETQPLITGGKPDDIITEFFINIGGARIKVNKLDSESNLPIKNSNIKFNLINYTTGDYVYMNGTNDLSINEDGYFMTDLLPYGEYKLIEIATSNDYTINDVSSIFLVNKDTVDITNNIYEFNFYNTLAKGNIQIIKKDSYSKKKLAGVEFGLYALEDIVTSDGTMHYKKDELIKKGTTDNDGILIFEKMIYGNYYIREINTIEGYVLDNNHYQVDLNKQDYSITIENELEKGSFTIQKYGQVFDSKNSSYNLKALENVEFTLLANEDIVAPDGTLYYKRNEVVSVLKTNEFGILEFSDLILGDYCIIETKTLPSYILNQKRYCYNLKIYKGMYLEFVNYLKKGNLKINKLDYDSKLPIKDINIKFNIKNKETGEYIYLNETKDLSINEDGFLIINNLPYGKYEIVEIDSSPMYELNNIPLIIDIDQNTVKDDLVTVNFYNKLKRGSIALTKYGEKFNFKTHEYTYEKLEDVEFALYAADDIISNDGTIHYLKDTFITSLKTNNEGIIEFNNLVLGKYYLVECQTKDEYIIDNSKYYFDLYEEQTSNIEVINNLKKGNLKINKLDYDSKLPIKDINIKFNIKNKETGEYIYLNETKDLSINEDGFLIINNLPYGKYEIVEIDSSPMYELNNILLIIDIDENTIKDDLVTVNFYNKLKRGSIILKKYGEKFNFKTHEYTYEKLEDVEFALYAADDIISNDGTIHYLKDTFITSLKTNNEGIIEFNNLVLGKYYLVECQTKDEYIIDNSKYYFDLYEEQTSNIEVINNLKKGNLKINKLDYDSKLPIKDINIKFNIKNKETGEYIYLNETKDLSINEDGFLIINNLPYGKYEIVEIDSSPMYELNNISLIIDVDENTIKDDLVTVNFYNKLKRGSIILKKYGEKFNFKTLEYTYEKLEDVEFALYAADDIISNDGTIHYLKDTFITSLKTNDEGIIEFNNLVLGKYYLVECQTKDEYIIDNSKYYFDLYEEQTADIEVINNLKKENLKIIKIDDMTDEPLADVYFEIYHNAILLGTYQTNEFGIIQINNLPITNYEILEIKTLDNYVIDYEIKTIDLEHENEIVIKNKKKVELPNTLSNDYSIVISIIFFALGIFLLGYDFYKKIY